MFFFFFYFAWIIRQSSPETMKAVVVICADAKRNVNMIHNTISPIALTRSGTTWKNDIWTKNEWKRWNTYVIVWNVYRIRWPERSRTTNNDCGKISIETPKITEEKKKWHHTSDHIAADILIKFYRWPKKINEYVICDTIYWNRFQFEIYLYRYT